MAVEPLGFIALVIVYGLTLSGLMQVDLQLL
jgi:hypothetical protein